MAGRPARLAVAFGATALLATVVVGCGGKDAQAEAQELILGAAQATFGGATAQVLITLGDDEGEGQVDFEGEQSQVTLAQGAQETTVWVDGSDVLLGIDDVVTLIDVDQLDTLGVLRFLLLQLSPAAVVQLLDGLADDADIQIFDDDTIDGVDVRHFGFQIDVDTLLDQLDGDARDLLDLLLTALDVDSLDLDVWLDSDGRVVQLRYDVPAADDDEDDVRFTMGLREYGADVEIDVPDADDALDAQEFELARADVSGTWTLELTVSGSDNTTAQPNGPQDPSTASFDCAPNTTCTNSESGNDWTLTGPGEFTVDDVIMTDCTANDTGALVLANSATITYHTVWTVTEVDEDGNAVEMTGTGTVMGQVTPAGIANNCPFVGGGNSFSADTSGTATRN